MQAVPAFLIGLYSLDRKTDVHPWCIATGAFSATSYVFGIYFGYTKGADSPLPIDAGLTGLALQLGLIFVMEGFRLILGISKSAFALGQKVTDDDSSISTLLFPKRPLGMFPS